MEKSTGKKHGFIKPKRYASAALIVFLIVSIFGFTPMCSNVMVAGLSLSGWLFVVLGILMPVYCIIIEYIEDKKKSKK